MIRILSALATLGLVFAGSVPSGANVGANDSWIDAKAVTDDGGKAVVVKFKTPSPGGQALKVMQEIRYARRDKVADLKLDFFSLEKFKASFEKAKAGDLEKNMTWHKVQTNVIPIAVFFSTKEDSFHIPYVAEPARGQLGKVVKIEPKAEDFVLVVAYRGSPDPNDAKKTVWDLYAYGHTAVKAGAPPDMNLELRTLQHFKAGGENRKSLVLRVHEEPTRDLENCDWTLTWTKEGKSGSFKTNMSIFQGYVQCSTTFAVTQAMELKEVSLVLTCFKKAEKTVIRKSKPITVDLNSAKN